MNTEKSDKFIKAWRQKENPLKRASLVHQRTFKTSPEALFRLLCPTTEYDWLVGFECELLHSNSGYAEYNAIFRTSLFGADEIWICSHYEPNKSIEYTRVSEDFSGKLDISLVDNCDGTVTVTWVTILSALNENGNQAVAELKNSQKRFAEIIDELEHYVNTGEMISKLSKQ